jgi:hypothetical protein
VVEPWYAKPAPPDPEVLQEKLRQLVADHGYTWKEWTENRLPQDIKWEITKRNSENILQYLKEVEASK